MNTCVNSGMAGFLVIFFAGLIGGFAPTSLKFMRRFAYEHWGLVSSLVGFLIVPWTMLFFICPDVPGALRAIPLHAFLVGNALSMTWGVANVLYCICLVRIGFSLTHGIISGIAIPAGVITPMILKGSGVFANAPGPFSRSGLVILLGVAMMLAAVILVSKAGFGRETATGGGGQGKRGGGTFLAGLAMCVIAGVTSIASMVLTCVGMPVLGALGPSIGFGVNQARQIVGSQSVGFLFGEWRGVPRRYIRTMAVAIILLLAAVAVIAYGNAVG